MALKNKNLHWTYLLPKTVLASRGQNIFSCMGSNGDAYEAIDLKKIARWWTRNFLYTSEVYDSYTINKSCYDIQCISWLYYIWCILEFLMMDIELEREWLHHLTWRCSLSQGKIICCKWSVKCPCLWQVWLDSHYKSL